MLYIHALMDLPNGDLVAAGAIYCGKKSCLLKRSLKYDIQLLTTEIIS